MKKVDMDGCLLSLILDLANEKDGAICVGEDDELAIKQILIQFIGFDEILFYIVVVHGKLGDKSSKIREKGGNLVKLFKCLVIGMAFECGFAESSSEHNLVKDLGVDLTQDFVGKMERCFVIVFH